MHKLIDFSLNHRLLVLAAWLLVVAVGIRSLGQLPIDAVPDVTNVQVQILTQLPALAPEEVERFITFPVETAMSGLPRLEEIRSISKFGLSVVTVVFTEGTDIYWARQLVGERLAAAREEIPAGYGTPEMGPISTGLGEIFQFEVRTERPCGDGGDTAECYTPMELREILDWFINYQLRAVAGVVEVNAFGGELKSYQVTLDPARLAAYRLTVGDVVTALSRNNRNVGGAYIAHAGEQYLVRGEGLIETLTDLAQVVVATRGDGTPIYTRDLGRIELAPMVRQGAVTRDGRGEAVVGIVMMLLGENSRTVTEAVKAKIEKIQSGLPPGVTIDPFYDRTELVDRTIHTVAKNLIEGGVLVVLVLLLLLGNLRGGLIVAAAIPLSMLAAFTAMRWAGLSGNLMSLGAIDFGLIVDGSVVMVENILRLLHERRDDGHSHLEKVRAAAHQVARPVAFAVGIILIVYLPILTLRGVEGKMFRPMALTVVFALAASLIAALTLMPVLASLLLKRVREREPLLFRLARGAYGPLLRAATRKPAITFAVAVATFGASLAVVPFLGAEFIPRLDEGAIALQIWRLPSISLEESNRISTAVERAIRDRFPEVKTVVSRTGRPEIATDPMGVEISDTYLILNDRATWRFETKEALIAAIDETLKARIPGAIYSYSQPIELRIAELISGVRSDVAINVYGDDIDRMHQVAEAIVAVVGRIAGAADAKAEQTTGLPVLRIRLDHAAMARYGLAADDVLDVVETLGGKVVGTVIEGQKRFALQVRFDASVRDLDRVRDLAIPLPASATGRPRLVALAQVATLDIVDGPAQISRENISRRTSVEVNVRGRDLAGFVAEAQAAVAKEVALPPGWVLEWGGQFENLQAASQRLVVLLPLALGVIFVLLYSAFASGRLALLIYLNVPLALSGGLLALAARGYPFSISAGVGFIALFGVAVLNGVVLVSYIVDRQIQGMAPAAAAVEGAKVRLRPVLMTGLVASLGFLPMALATSAGAEVQRPLATVVIGGLLTSTLLTLLVLPAVYRWFVPGETPESEAP
ncbi:MAG: CusA/CzcA family heavy metal efflux RND transporter [Nitrospirae bacterium CG06_land_8_20_14_3_00_70_43]|nr:MAG: CusA/CzcA family heavy metal efflux RND transporter [Nitrospirae bacterium CG06_land_8_20_14_3_00_70_43]